MPRDLFDAVAVRPPSLRSHRAPIVSVIAHAIGIIFAVVVSLVGSDVLPVPHEALEFFEPALRLAEVPLPPPPQPARPSPEADTPVQRVNPNAAPTVAPEGIRPESGIEHEIESRREGVLVGFGDGTRISALEDAPPPPPAPAMADPVRLHSGVRAPVKLTNVAPVYPPTALAVRLQGLVILEATIDVDGNVVSAKVLKSVPLLDQAAVDAVRQWKFTPTLLNGVPVSVIMTVTVNFKLQ